MSGVGSLVRRYMDRYNSNDVDGMLDCCTDDVLYESVTNPHGAMRLRGKAEVREAIEATARAFRERRQEVVAMIVDGERAAAETVFSGVATTTLGEAVRSGEHVSIRTATIFEAAEGRIARICDYG